MRMNCQILHMRILTAACYKPKSGEKLWDTVFFAEWISGQAAPLRKSNGMIGKRKKLLQNTKQNFGWQRSSFIASLSDQDILPGCK